MTQPFAHRFRSGFPPRRVIEHAVTIHAHQTEARRFNDTVVLQRLAKDPLSASQTRAV
jgi:hypothetical protein